MFDKQTKLKIMLKTTMKQILYAIGVCATIILFFNEKGWGHTTYTLGSGTDYTQSETFTPVRPWYQNHQLQYLIKGSELTSAGAEAGRITKIELYIYEAPTTDMEGFNISMKTTSTTALTGTFETGLTTVYSAAAEESDDYSDGTWKTYTLSTPINWDGESNIIVQFCFDNTGSNYSEAGGVYTYNPGSYNCAQGVFADADTDYGCGSTESATTSTSRAQMKFTIEEAPTLHNT